MPALTSLHPATPVASSCALVIGKAPLNRRLEALLPGSHWKFEHAVDARDAVERLARDPVPAVLCGRDEWRDVVKATGVLLRPPQVIVLTTVPDDVEWLEVLAAKACYIDGRRLTAPRFFSLLNHAWGTWNDNTKE